MILGLLDYFTEKISSFFKEAISVNKCSIECSTLPIYITAWPFAELISAIIFRCQIYSKIYVNLYVEI